MGTQLPVFEVAFRDGTIFRGVLTGDRLRLEMDDLGGGSSRVGFLSHDGAREMVQKLGERLGVESEGVFWDCPICTEEFKDRVPLTSRVRLAFRAHLVNAHHLHPDAAEVEYDRAVEAAGGAGIPMGRRRFAELVRHASDLVDDGHIEGGHMFELLDEIDRMRGRPLSSAAAARARGWQEDRAKRKKAGGKR